MDSKTAFERFDPEQVKKPNGAGGGKHDDGWQQAAPIPEGMPEQVPGNIIARATPPQHRHVGGWPYRNRAGRVLFRVERFDGPRKADGTVDKQTRPFTAFVGPQGGWEWRCKALPKPRPLYGLDRLAARPDAPILVVEGEKTADAATRLFPDYVVVTSPNGANAARDADWTPIAGRHVKTLRDADEPGATYVADVAAMAHKAGAASVANVRLPEGLPEGWDVADPLPDGFTETDLREWLDNAEPVEPEPEPADPLEGLIERAKADPGEAFKPEVQAALVALKQEDRARYETLRAQLKAAGVRVTALDETVSAASGGGDKEMKQADILIAIAEDEADLFHAPDGTGFANLDINGHRETWAIRSKGFKRWLARRFYEVVDGAPSSEALQSALNVIEAKAHFDAPEHEVHIRVGGFDGRLYLDLGDETWRAVEIDPAGWRVIDNPPVRFRRAAGMRPLPVPVAGGSIDALRRFLNVGDDDDFVLAISWVLACLRNRGPYPVLALSGEQGSAKSTFSAILRALIDPNSAPLRALPREDRDLFIAANNGHVLSFDNVSGLPAWISDTLCRLATGGGFAVRQLYSDQDEVLFDASRPVILNGIEDIVTRPDLADRALFLTLEPIPEEGRRPEQELWAEFEAERPYILGALLDAVATGLDLLPGTRLKTLPRMADFALWATACETAIWQPGTFWDAYCGNRDAAVEGVIDADPVASAVRTLMLTRTVWTGTAADLLGALSESAGERIAKAKTWPDSTRALSGRLRRAATFLRKIGIEIGFGREGKARTRVVHITVSPGAEKEGNFASASSAISENGEKHSAGNGLVADDMADDRRTQTDQADGRADGRRTQTDQADDRRTQAEEFCVRHNCLDLNDDPAARPQADEADAKIPSQSGAGKEGAPAGKWRMKI